MQSNTIQDDQVTDVSPLWLRRTLLLCQPRFSDVYIFSEPEVANTHPNMGRILASMARSATHVYSDWGHANLERRDILTRTSIHSAEVIGKIAMVYIEVCSRPSIYIVLLPGVADGT